MGYSSLPATYCSSNLRIMSIPQVFEQGLFLFPAPNGEGGKDPMGGEAAEQREDRSAAFVMSLLSRTNAPFPKRKTQKASLESSELFQSLAKRGSGESPADSSQDPILPRSVFHLRANIRAPDIEREEEHGDAKCFLLFVHPSEKEEERRIEERVPGGSQLRIAGGRRRRSIVQRWTPNPLSTKSPVSSSSLFGVSDIGCFCFFGGVPLPLPPDGSIHTPQSHGSCFQVNISHERRAIILEYKKASTVSKENQRKSLSLHCACRKNILIRASRPQKNITYFFPLKRKKHLPLFFPFLCSLQPVIS